MTEQPINLVVLVGSVRDGRFGPTVATWFTGQADAHAGTAVEVVDLVDYPLPLVMPAPGRRLSGAAGQVRDALAARLAAADAFVVVTPEYNHSFPAALKNVLDWFLDEWAAKPVGFVSYGGTGGGLRAVEHLRQTFAELHAVTVRESVSFHDAWHRFDEHGHLRYPAGGEGAAKTMLDQLCWWGLALRGPRATYPYRR